MTTGTNEYKCFKCLETFTDTENFHDPDGERVCPNCYHNNYLECRSCGSVCIASDSYYIDQPESRVCGDCYDLNYFCCDDCGRYFHNDYYVENGRCENCNADNSNDNDGYESINRHYHTGNDYVDTHQRAYSVELETYYNDNDDINAVADTLPQAIGISADGSLHGSYGKEFQTPKLSGDKGEKLLQKLCETLTKNNFFVDKSCGLHIHLDGSDYQGKSSLVKKLWLFYLMFEPVLYSYLPYSRRINHYCMPLSQFYQETEIYYAQDYEQLEKIWYREQRIDRVENRKKEKYDQTRYAGVNFHSLFKDGHLEIRHHSGTIDHKKIKNWIELHLAILNRVAGDSFSTGDILKAKYALDLNRKQELMFSYLGLSDETKAYFLARGKKFSQAVKEEIKCAE